MDNGFARFDQVLIPRRNMAMRFAHVNEQGAYSKNKSANTDATSKVAYITMMQVRAHIVNEAGKNLALACTMSIRYSAVRRQGFRNDNDKQEVQIIDYRQQQHRLFPLLAASYCFFFTGRKILAQLKALEERMLSGSGTVTKAQVADIHASSSALKSFTTTVTADGIEDCRKACGGHGFLQSSGLPELSLTYLQSPTVEGDNHMLPQQVVKVLLKIVQTVQSNNEAALAEYDMCDSKYLIEPLRSMLSQRKHENKPSCTATSRVEMRQLPVLLKALQHRSARLLLEVAQQLELSVRAGASAEQAWNDALIQMARMSRAHSLFLLLNNFVSSLETERDRSDSDTGPHEIQVLQDLAVLFGLYWIERDMGDFLEDAYLSKEQASWVRGAVLDMLDVVRPNAVALVDARDFSDFRLKSCVGRWDGNVYEAILESSKRDPLNATEPGPGYDAHLRKLIVQGAARYTGTSSRL
jgi:acyl-CoA oxidase